MAKYPQVLLGDWGRGNCSEHLLRLRDEPGILNRVMLLSQVLQAVPIALAKFPLRRPAPAPKIAIPPDSQLALDCLPPTSPSGDQGKDPQLGRNLLPQKTQPTPSFQTQGIRSMQPTQR